MTVSCSIVFDVQIGFGAMPAASSFAYGFPNYAGAGSGGPGSGSYLASPGLVYQPPQQPSSSYSPRSPGEAVRLGVGVKVERSPDSQGGSSVGSSSSGRPPTGSDSPAPDYHRRPPLIPPPHPSGFYYPDDVREMIGMYLPADQVNSPGEPHISHQWMNPGRFAHHYVTPSGHVGSDVTDDAARINGAFARLV